MYQFFAAEYMMDNMEAAILQRRDDNLDGVRALVVNEECLFWSIADFWMNVRGGEGFASGEGVVTIECARQIDSESAKIVELSRGIREKRKCGKRQRR
jgi:hypothetical protein